MSDMTKDEDDPNVRLAATFDTATLSDALDRLGIVAQCSNIAPCDPGFRLAGRAFTILYGPAASPPGTVGDYIDDVPSGSVIVLDNGGRTDVTVWGDILTEIAHRRGLAGTVIDGTNRDVALCRELRYPIFSRHTWMRTGKDRVQVEAVGMPVTVGGARVAAGDLLRGDADGVVVIPKEHEQRVLQIAQEIHDAEQKIRESVRAGARLDHAREQFRYHRLQSRESK
jgi:4-hydroxy-4-methyl-2-oxoglutarate aldolase